MGCRTTDFLLSRELRSPHSAPFIGLVTLKSTTRTAALDRTRAYLRGVSDRIRPLFREYPYVAAWCVTQALSEAYGDEDHAIYRHIEQAFGVRLQSSAIRNLLFEGFCEVCDKLDLPTRGFNRMVDLYLLHAGVPVAQLPYLIDAFQRQESAFGPPPTTSSVHLNAWEDESLDFLPATVVTPRRAILWDDTAWHAGLYARIRENEDAYVPRTPFEERFVDALRERQRAPNRAGAVTQAIAQPRPRLVWRGDGLALRLPKTQGRLQLWHDDGAVPLRLRGGEDWMLPQPWPRQLRWQIGAHAGTLEFLGPLAAVAVFDKTTGYLVKEIVLSDRDLEVDATDAVIVARTELSVGGEPALEVGDECFVGFARLGSRPIHVATSGQTVSLRARPRRRISLHEALIATGPQGALFGPEARVRIETGVERTETRRLRAAVGSGVAETEVEVIDGYGETRLAELLRLPALAEQGPDPLRLRIELLAAAEPGTPARSSGVLVEGWVWPGFSGSDGYLLDSTIGPENFILDQSRNVGRDGRGRLCLDPMGGYLTARAVFGIGGSTVAFDLPWPDVAILRNRLDGSSVGIPMGARLTIGDEHRFETITVRCPDPKASLIVRGRHEKNPFVLGMSRSLALRDLLSPAPDNKVMLRRSSGSEILLFELVPSTAPADFSFLPARDAIRLRIRLNGPIDAVAIEIERERGETEFAASGLGRPVESRRPAWFEAALPDGDPHEVELLIAHQGLTEGTALARILVRPADGAGAQDAWRPLRNARGDTYAIGLPALDEVERVPNDELVRRFQVISRWLADCYPIECWPRIEATLVRRWRDIGSRLLEMPGGRGALMIAATTEPPDHTSTSWVPIVHPLQISPDMYAGPPSDFAPLTSAPEPGLAEVAALHAVGQTRLRDPRSGLDGVMYLAFRNCQEARSSDVPLSGFDPRKLFQLLPMLDSDPSAGWFWRGSPLLGPQHWRAAHLRFVERLEAVGLFVNEEAEDGPNSRREMALNQLIRAAWQGTAPDERPPVPLRSPDSEEPDMIDCWAAATLSGFARASRFGEPQAYIGSLSRTLGWPEHKLLESLSMLLRLAPELFAFFLITWQIAKDRP